MLIKSQGSRKVYPHPDQKQQATAEEKAAAPALDPAGRRCGHRRLMANAQRQSHLPLRPGTPAASPPCPSSPPARPVLAAAPARPRRPPGLQPRGPSYCSHAWTEVRGPGGETPSAGMPCPRPPHYAAGITTHSRPWATLLHPSVERELATAVPMATQPRNPLAPVDCAALPQGGQVCPAFPAPTARGSAALPARLRTEGLTGVFLRLFLA